MVRLDDDAVRFAWFGQERPLWRSTWEALMWEWADLSDYWNEDGDPTPMHEYNERALLGQLSGAAWRNPGKLECHCLEEYRSQRQDARRPGRCDLWLEAYWEGTGPLLFIVEAKLLDRVSLAPRRAPGVWGEADRRLRSPDAAVNPMLQARRYTGSPSAYVALFFARPHRTQRGGHSRMKAAERAMNAPFPWDQRTGFRFDYYPVASTRPRWRQGRDAIGLTVFGVFERGAGDRRTVWEPEANPAP